VKAICVCSDAAKLSMNELRDFVGEKIAGFKKPREIIFVEELPHVNNEIDRETVKAKWGA
jgi:acyl-coenzyme A synthetase/AMP-(fatty) acid ligase